MALQLLLGGSGSGKSYELYQNIIRQSLEHPKRNYLIIVPEQFTMQTQKELVSLHPGKGIMNIDVLSFQRLAYRVFEEVGADQRLVLEDTGKSLVLRKLAGEHEDKLKILGSNLKKTGYISEMKSVISEFTQYNVSDEVLAEMIARAEDKPQLSDKLHDIRILFNAFREFQEDKYITAEELLELLCDVARDSLMLKNSVVALDGFTGFTPIQNKLLKVLLTTVRQMYVTVTIDVREAYDAPTGEHRLFFLSKKTIHKLYQMAAECQVLIKEPQLLGVKERRRFALTPALSFLEQNLFRYSGQVYREKQAEISLHTARNPVEELHFVCRRIRDLVDNQGCRYRDITIITGDMNSYSNHLEKLLAVYEIPGFIDNKRTILLNPLIEFIRSALDMIVKNYTYESVFRFLRCGLSDLTQVEIDQLENYVIALGVRGYQKWSQKFTRVYQGMKAETLEEIDQIRARFMALTTPFAKSCKKLGADVTAYTKALYQLIVSCDMQTRLKRYEMHFHNQGEPSLAKEYAQIYGIIMELLDKLVELLGTEKMPVKEYAQIIDAGFQEAKVGIIPPSVDRVVVGDIERTRLQNIKILFFVGVNDGIIPKSSAGSGIISELDRELLASWELELAPTARQNAFIQKLYLYIAMTKPSERLYLSYSKMSMDGKALRPSYLINVVKKLYEQLSVEDEDEHTGITERTVTYKNGLPLLIEGIRQARDGQVSDAWKELYSRYYQNPDYRGRLMQIIDGAFFAPAQEKLGRAVAKALYGTVLENSVTRLERFAACEFAHFLDYGLQLSKREEYEFLPVDMGNIFHNALEKFSTKLEDSEFDWFTLTEAKREQLVETCVDEEAADYKNTVLHSDARNEYMINRIKRILDRTVWALQEQVRKGAFIPSHYEISFSRAEHLEAVNITLSPDEKMKLKGRIDRIDICEAEEKLYVKVIDYKSGNTSFDLVALYHGLQLQLVVYLNAAMELEQRQHPEKEILPAGIFYYNMQDSITDREAGDTPEKVNQRLLKQLRLNGLVNEDPQIITRLDRDLQKSSLVIPVTLNKDGSPSKVSSVASQQEFDQLSQYVNRKIEELGRGILAGNIDVSPYQMKDKTACDYCSYNGICGFDKKTPGYEYRRLKDYQNKQEVWARILTAAEIPDDQEEKG